MKWRVDGITHVFSDFAATGAVALKIIQQCLRLLTNVAKVHCFSTLGKEQQSVKVLKEQSTRLMNRSQHSLSVVRKLSHEGTNSPGTLGIQTRSRLIQEDQQLRLCCQLDTNTEKLSLAHVEAITGVSDHSFGKVFHIQHLDHFFHVGVFLLEGNGLGLSQNRTEAKCFTNCRLGQMQILLLYIANFARETCVQVFAVDE